MIQRTFPFLLSMLMLTPIGCGDDDNQTQNDAAVQDADTQNDAEVQQDADVQQDAGPETQGCTGESPAVPVGLGGCCNDDTDCTSPGRCLAGWCSRNCATDADCTPTVPGPFVTGTPMSCNTNQLNLGNWCLPGSLQDCAGENDSPCPTGEVCIGGWNDDATVPAEGFRGICVTAFSQAGVLSPGESYVASTNPEFYQCQAPGYHFSGKAGRRCSEACDPANPTDTCPTGLQCSEVWASRYGNSVISGVGLCVGSYCGRMEFTGDDDNDVRIPGSNDDCPTGEWCSPEGMHGVDGDVMTHQCILADATKGQIGDDCEHAEKFDMTCDNLVYCIQSAAEYDTAGAYCNADEDCATDEVCADHTVLPSRCTAKPDTGVCSLPCRTDADCPTLNGGPSLCTEGAWSMASGEDGYLTYCLAWRFISDEAMVSCVTNADCNTDDGFGCVNLSNHSATRFCLAHVTQDATGADCATNGVADCQAGEACVEDTDAATFLCTGVLAMGDACDSTGKQRCLGAQCLDIEWQPDDGGTATNTFCSGFCASNADCGTNQVCDWGKSAENDPTTTADDVTGTICRTMMVRSGAGCSVPGDCTNGDACDTTTGRCYTTAAAWGDACTQHSDCPVFGLCDTDVTGGVCYRPGCNPANGNTDCDSSGACSDALSIGRCLEDCTTTADCSRSAAGFTCQGGACLAP